jgi:hypothetical protein
MELILMILAVALAGYFLYWLIMKIEDPGIRNIFIIALCVVVFLMFVDLIGDFGYVPRWHSSLRR